VTAALGFKRLGMAIAACVVAGFGALALMSFLISPDSARDAVKAEIRAATGFDPILRGPITVSLFPYGAVNFTDVIFDNNLSTDPAFSVERLTASLRLLPLLLGRIEIADISLARPHVIIDFDSTGRSNWLPLVDMLASALKPRTSASKSAVSFSEIRISQGTITLRNRARGTVETLHDIEMSLAWPSISKSFGATGRFNWHNETLDANITISDFFSALTGNRSGLKFRIGGAPLKLAFEGAVSTQPNLKVEGTLAVDSSSLRDTLQWTGQQPFPGGGFGPFALKAQTNLTAGTFSLSNVHVELDGNAAEGVLAFAATNHDAVQGTLAAEKIDLTPYIAAVRLLATNTRAWDLQPIDLDGLAGIDLDLRLSSRQVTIGSAKLGRTAIAANLRDGKLAITIGESEAFGGTIKGSLELAKSEMGTDLKTQLNFSDVDLDQSLGDIFGFRRIEGKGDISFAVEGSGANVQALTHTLNGAAKLSSGKGALTGFNIEQLLRRLERRPLSGGSNFRGGRTPFDSLNVALKIIQGIANVEEMRLEGAAVKLSLTGAMSIPSRDFDLKGTASLFSSASAPAAGFELPFVVQGPWDDPMMLPDPQSLIRRSGAAAPLLDAVKDRKAREAVKSAIERLTGSPAPSSLTGR